MELWHNLLLRLYSSQSYPADWAFLLRFCKTVSLDAEDTAFAAAIWDMNDRVGASQLTLTSSVGLAFSDYFGVAREQRTLELYLKLLNEMQKQSKLSRAALSHTAHTGLAVFELASMLDAYNNSTLHVDSATNILSARRNELGWRRFQKFACHMSEVIHPTAKSQGKTAMSLYQLAKKALGMKCSYRPAHIARLAAVVWGGQYPKFINDLFQVNEDLLRVCESYFPLSLAAVVACQCQKVPRTKEVFNFLSAVADDRVGFLMQAASLSAEEARFVKRYFYFGPNRIEKSTTKSGLFKKAWRKYRAPLS